MGGLIAGIIIGIVIAVLAGYFYTNPNALASIRSINPIDMTQSFSSAPREPIAVYTNCVSEIRGDITNGHINTNCYKEGGQLYIDKHYRFTMPAVFDDNDIIILRTQSTVYQYGENDFELGIRDQVGEKRYPVKLWELPT